MQEQARAEGRADALMVPSEEVLCAMIDLAHAGRPSDAAWDALVDRSAQSSVGQEHIEVLEIRAVTALRCGRLAAARSALAAALLAAERIPNVMGDRLRRHAAAIAEREAAEAALRSGDAAGVGRPTRAPPPRDVSPGGGEREDARVVGHAVRKRSRQAASLIFAARASRRSRAAASAAAASRARPPPRAPRRRRAAPATRPPRSRPAARAASCAARAAASASSASPLREQRARRARHGAAARSGGATVQRRDRGAASRSAPA